MNPTQNFELCKDLNIFRKLEKKMKQASGRYLLTTQWHSTGAAGLRSASGPWPYRLGLMAQRYGAAWHYVAHTVLLCGRA
jgi:hypothetical protein